MNLKEFLKRLKEKKTRNKKFTWNTEDIVVLETTKKKDTKKGN